VSIEPTPPVGAPIEPTETHGKTAEDLFLDKVRAAVTDQMNVVLKAHDEEIKKKLDELNKRYDTLGKAVINIDERGAPNQPAGGQPQQKGMIEELMNRFMGGLSENNNNGGPFASFYNKYHEQADKKLLQSMGNVLGVDLREHVAVDQ